MFKGERGSAMGRSIWLALASYGLLLSSQLASANTVSVDDQSGTTDFRLSIDKVGKIVACEITRSSGNADDDGRACRYLISRARLSLPTEDGHPIAAVYTGRIRLQIGQEASIGFRKYDGENPRVDQIIVMSRVQKPLFLTAHLLIGADAKVERCIATKSSGDAAVDEAACAALIRSPIRPAVDAHQRPVRSIWDMKVMVRREAPTDR
jgi:hypothetical protein